MKYLLLFMVFGLAGCFDAPDHFIVPGTEAEAQRICAANGGLYILRVSSSHVYLDGSGETAIKFKCNNGLRGEKLVRTNSGSK